jgi:hypothetical protein
LNKISSFSSAIKKVPPGEF